MDLDALIKEHGGLVAAMKALIGTAQSEGRDLTDEEQKTFADAEAKANVLESRITRAQDLEARSAKFAKPVIPPAPGAPKKPAYGQTAVKWKMGGDPVNLFARQAIAMYHGGSKYGASEYAKNVMGDEVLAWMLNEGPESIIRAAVGQSSTTDPNFTPLVAVREAAEQFIELLRPASVYVRLQAGASLDFGRDGSVKIPRQTGGVSGGWVGEGLPIKVNRMALGSVTLSPKKMAVIAFSTQELMDHSNPSLQGLLTADLVKGTAQAIDTSFVDAVAASALRPAGIRTYGTSDASAGTALVNIMTDIKTAKTKLVNANVAMSSPVWLMSETTRIALELVVDTVGQAAFPEIMNGTWRGYPVLSSNTVGNFIILIDSSDLIKAMDLAPVIDSSTDATLNADDAPVGDVSTAVTPVYSMFQTDQVAIRLRTRLDWGMRHTEAVHTTTGVNYA